MKRLKPHEIAALQFLHERGSDCIGTIDSDEKFAAAWVFADLYKRKLLLMEVGDAGPVYSLSPLGQIEVAKFGVVSDA